MANPKKIDISRDYLPIDFVARRGGCEVDDLVYLAGKDCLDVFVLAAGWLADAFILNCDIWGIASPHEGVLVTGPVQLYSGNYPQKRCLHQVELKFL